MDDATRKAIDRCVAIWHANTNLWGSPQGHGLPDDDDVRLVMGELDAILAREAEASPVLCESLGDYRSAPSGVGPLAAEWRDKPHRLVYDLCEEVQRLRELSVAAFVTACEKTQPVTAEWLDGSEGKRLTLSRTAGCDVWRTLMVDNRWATVVLECGGAGVTAMQGSCFARFRVGCETIAQFRAAVFLATGRT